MNRNHELAFGAAVLSAVDLNWFPDGLSQEVIEAGNQGKLTGPLTQFFLSRGWLPPCPPPLPVNRSITIEEVLGCGWSVWRGSIIGNGLDLAGALDQDRRSAQINEIDPNKIVTYTGLVGDETVITGEERLKRMRAQTEIIPFDFRTLWALYAEKGQKILRWLYDNGKISRWLEELGTILRSPDGSRYSLILVREGDGSWGWDVSWLGLDRYACNPAVGLAS